MKRWVGEEVRETAEAGSCEALRFGSESEDKKQIGGCEALRGRDDLK